MTLQYEPEDEMQGSLHLVPIAPHCLHIWRHAAQVVKGFAVADVASYCERG